MVHEVLRHCVDVRDAPFPSLQWGNSRVNVYRWNQPHTTPSMSFNTATEAEEEEEEAAVESQALPVGDSDECGPPRGCSEPMVPSLAQFTWRRCAAAANFTDAGLFFFLFSKEICQLAEEEARTSCATSRVDRRALALGS